MSTLYSKKHIGKILQEAGLVSAAQIQLALQDQSYHKDLRIGEILALRGWLNQETVDFFVEKLPVLCNQDYKKPLGYYLKEAGLLSDQQIHIILSEQKKQQVRVRFGKLVVLKGFLSKATIDFFLKNLAIKAESERVFISKKIHKNLTHPPR